MAILNDYYSYLELQENLIEEILVLLRKDIHNYLRRELTQIYNLLVANGVFSLTEDDLELIEEKINQYIRYFTNIEKEVDKMVEKHNEELSAIIPLLIGTAYIFGFNYAGEVANRKKMNYKDKSILPKDINDLINIISNKKVSKEILKVLNNGKHIITERTIRKNAYKYLYNSNLQLGARISDNLKEGIKNEILKGIKHKYSDKQVVNNISNFMLSEGIKSVDTAKKKFGLEHYAKLVVRTEMMRAFNSAVINRQISNGYYYVKIPNISTSCGYCKPWLGEILFCLNNNRNDKRNKLKKQTLAYARSKYLHHPGCKHPAEPVED